MRWYDRRLPNWVKILWAVLMVSLGGVFMCLVIYGVVTDPRMCS